MCRIELSDFRVCVCVIGFLVMRLIVFFMCGLMMKFLLVVWLMVLIMEFRFVLMKFSEILFLGLLVVLFWVDVVFGGVVKIGIELVIIVV